MTSYELRISDWSSDVCSSDLGRSGRGFVAVPAGATELRGPLVLASPWRQSAVAVARDLADAAQRPRGVRRVDADHAGREHPRDRSGGEHAPGVGPGPADPARPAARGAPELGSASRRARGRQYG